MQTYPIPMVPGPTRVPEAVLSCYLTNYGSADLETDYLDLYNLAETNLQKLLATHNKVTIHTGEGMIALWGALKSCLQPGDRVLSLSTVCLARALAIWRAVAAPKCALSILALNIPFPIGQP